MTTRTQAPRGQAPAATRPGRTSGPLIAIGTGYFMVILDTTVVNVALPSLGRALDTGTTGLQWVVDGYTLILAGFLLPAGALGDRLGAKRMFQAGMAAQAAGVVALAAFTAALIEAGRLGVTSPVVLGALVARRATFLPGLHAAAIIGGAAFLLGCGLTIAAVVRRPGRI
jgi:MFS transporter, DHA2 family, methylenomycin A resistance protein